MLNILGGFLEPTQGQVYIDGKNMAEIPPERRPTTTVFQDYALFPHMSVAGNVGFGLKMRRRRFSPDRGGGYLIHPTRTHANQKDYQHGTIVGGGPRTEDWFFRHPSSGHRFFGPWRAGFRGALPAEERGNAGRSN